MGNTCDISTKILRGRVHGDAIQAKMVILNCATYFLEKRDNLGLFGNLKFAYLQDPFLA